MNADTIRSSPLRRFAFGIGCGTLVALGMWLISTLSHNEKFGFGLTWQFAVTVVLFGGFLGLGVRKNKKQSPSDE